MDNIVRCLFNPFEVPKGNFGEKIIDGIKNNTGVALIDVSTGRQVSGPELFNQVTRLVASLTSLGCKSGDVICIFSQNSIEWIQMFAATVYIDAIPTPISHLLKEGELAFHMETVRPVVLFCEKSLVNIAIAAVQKLKKHKLDHIVVPGGHDGCHSLEKLLQRNGEVNTSRTETRRRRSGLDEAAILFSSGTTGLQKALALSHEGLLLESLIGRDPDTIFVFEKPLVFSPMSHAAGFILTSVGLMYGKTLHVMPRFEIQHFIGSLIKYEINELFVVPPVAIQLVKSPLVAQGKVHIKTLIVGAAPLGKDIELQLRTKFPGIRIRQIYGLTELTVMCTVVPARLIKSNKEGSIGLPVHNTEMKVIDVETSEALGPNKSGEICVRTPLRMVGYINNPKANQEILDKDGWTHTGDIGHYDADGFFYITDRIKELIKYNAFQVAPAELESVLLSHPDVADAAVIGLPDPNSGEIPMALVVLKASAKSTENQIAAFVNDKVAAHKKLRGGVKFTSSIPKTGSGKILRREIKAKLLGNKL